MAMSHKMSQMVLSERVITVKWGGTRCTSEHCVCRTNYKQQDHLRLTKRCLIAKLSDLMHF